MNIKWSKTWLLRVIVSAHLLLVSPFFMSCIVEAAPNGHQSQQNRGVSLDQAVAQVQQQTGGRVLRAKQQGNVHEIKVLMPSGVVKTFRINAR